MVSGGRLYLHLRPRSRRWRGCWTCWRRSSWTTWRRLTCRRDRRRQSARRPGPRASVPQHGHGCRCGSTSSRKRVRGSRSRAIVPWPRHVRAGADFVAFLDDDDLPRARLAVAPDRRAAGDRRRFGVRVLAPAGPTSSCPAGCATRAISARPTPTTATGTGFRPGLAPTTCWPRLTCPGAPGAVRMGHSAGIRALAAARTAICSSGRSEPASRYACAVQFDRGAHLGAAPSDPGRMLRRGFLLRRRPSASGPRPPAGDQVAGLAWSSWRKLGKSLLQLPLAGTGRALVGGPCSTRHTRWARSTPGPDMRYDYYLRRRG